MFRITLMYVLILTSFFCKACTDLGGSKAQNEGTIFANIKEISIDSFQTERNARFVSKNDTLFLYQLENLNSNSIGIFKYRYDNDKNSLFRVDSIVFNDAYVDYFLVDSNCLIFCKLFPSRFGKPNGQFEKDRNFILTINGVKVPYWKDSGYVFYFVFDGTEMTLLDTIIQSGATNNNPLAFENLDNDCIPLSDGVCIRNKIVSDCSRKMYIDGLKICNPRDRSETTFFDSLSSFLLYVYSTRGEQLYNVPLSVFGVKKNEELGREKGVLKYLTENDSLIFFSIGVNTQETKGVYFHVHNFKKIFSINKINGIYKEVFSFDCDNNLVDTAFLTENSIEYYHPIKIIQSKCINNKLLYFESAIKSSDTLGINAPKGQNVLLSYDLINNTRKVFKWDMVENEFINLYSLKEGDLDNIDLLRINSIDTEFSYFKHPPSKVPVIVGKYKVYFKSSKKIFIKSF